MSDEEMADFIAMDDLLAAKDAEIARLREALTEARGWVQDDVNADPRRRGEDVLERIDSALKGKGRLRSPV